jgi:hypothetical protein
VGGLIGLPVDVAAPPRAPGGREVVRRARTTAELRRAAAVLLDGSVPYVLVREAFPEAPRARFAVRRERGIGAWATVGDEHALLPLDPADARLLARAAGAPDGATEDAAADLLLRAAACADDGDLALELELYLGDAPAVVSATGRRQRR